MTNKNILVALDGSDHSIRALQFALEIQNYFKEKIIMLNVQPTHETFNTERFISRKEIDEYIEQQAEEQQVGLIVMGSRGLGSITGKILGSISNGVLKNSPCPVTIIP